MGERSSVVTMRLTAVTDDVMACADVIACDGVVARTHDSSRMAGQSFIKFGMISIPLEVSPNSYIFWCRYDIFAIYNREECLIGLFSSSVCPSRLSGEILLPSIRGPTNYVCGEK
jgi:hypothetical protein